MGEGRGGKYMSDPAGGSLTGCDPAGGSLTGSDLAGRLWVSRALVGVGIFCMLLVVCCLGGCGGARAASGNIGKVEYTVVESDEVPDEVREMIDNQGDRIFQMVFKTEGWMYVMRGYGKQESGGYSVQVTDVAVTEDSLHVASKMLGPGSEDEKKGDGKNPYYVIKLEDPGYPVTFDDAGSK